MCVREKDRGRERERERERCKALSAHLTQGSIFTGKRKRDEGESE